MRLLILAALFAIVDVAAALAQIGFWWSAPNPLVPHYIVFAVCVAMAVVGHRRLRAPKAASRAVGLAVSVVLVPIGVLFLYTSSVIPEGWDAHLAASLAPDDATEEEIRRLAGEPHEVRDNVRDDCATRGGVRYIAYTASFRGWWGLGDDYPSGSVVFCVNCDGKVVDRNNFQY